MLQGFCQPVGGRKRRSHDGYEHRVLVTFGARHEPRALLLFCWHASMRD
jgi:hypothetical protein